MPSSLTTDLERARRRLNVPISPAMKDHKIPHSAVAPHRRRQHPFNLQAFVNIMKIPAADMMRGWDATRDAIVTMVHGFSPWPEEHWMEAFKVLPVPHEDLSMAGKFCCDFLENSRNDALDPTRKIAAQLQLLSQHVSGNSLSTYTTNLLVTKALVKLTSDFLLDHLFNKSESETIISMALEAGASFLLHPALHINSLREMSLPRLQYIVDLLDAIGAVHQSEDAGRRNTAVNSMLDALVAHFHPSDVTTVREFNLLVKDINPVIGGTGRAIQQRRYSRIIEQLQEVNDEGYDDLFGFWCLDVTVHIALRKWLGYFGTIYRDVFSSPSTPRPFGYFSKYTALGTFVVKRGGRVTIVNFGYRGPKIIIGVNAPSIYVFVSKRHFAEGRRGVILAGVVVNDEHFVDGQYMLLTL
ncbi:hypothetical protein B0H13DRAFT_1897473 [Mycena leptocephala]|nr:hypothetical protein B0H13DRAFT_1897473 [Mycena leptocephala]